MPAKHTRSISSALGYVSNVRSLFAGNPKKASCAQPESGYAEVVRPPPVTIQPAPIASKREIACFCSAIQNTTEIGPYIGILASNNSKHRVWVPREPVLTSAKLVSLAELLSHAKPLKRERLKLSVRLASSVLQFHPMGWLQPRWSKQDILLIQAGSFQVRPSLETPVIRQAFPSEPSAAEAPETSAVEAPEPSIVEAPETSAVEVPENSTVEAPEPSIAEASEISAVEALATSYVEAPTVVGPQPQAVERPESAAVDTPTPETAVVNCNLSLFSLGIVLMELWFWRDIGNSQVNRLQTNKPNSCHLEELDIERYIEARRRIPELNHKAGRAYGDCVKRCLDGLNHVENPEEFMREAHQKVLRPLQENLEHFYNQKLEEIFKQSA